jgi:hypothetical protein
LDLLFWAFFGAYVVHLIDETLIAGGFVTWIARSFWPSYHAIMFFWFNAALLGLIALGNVMFESLGGHWVILPIIFIGGFATHAFTLHLYWTIRQLAYSPGLLTSLLYLVVFYLLARYGLGGHLVTAFDFWVGTVVGAVLVGGFLSLGPIVIFPALMRREP